MTTDFLHGVEVIQIDSGTRPIKTVKSAVIGLIGTAPDADPNVFPLNQPVLLVNQPRLAGKLDVTGKGLGTLKDAMDDIYDQAGAMVIIVRVANGSDITATISNIVGDVTAGTGIHAFMDAQSLFGVTPRILIAPGYTSQRFNGLKNPVMAELETIAPKLRGWIVADGPGTNDVDAVAYANDFGSDRVYIVEGGVKVWNVITNSFENRPAAARVAGVIARTDATKGFWWSPSNKEIFGIGGTSRPINFNMSDVNSQANYLNENKIAVVVNQSGYRLWGNRTTSSDPKWAFLSVRRTADMIYESVEKAFLWAVDRPFSEQLLRDIEGSVQDYLNSLKARGAIIGGSCWLDKELNTQSSLESGQIYFDFDIEPPAPMERLTYRAYRNNGYYSELMDKLIAA